MRPRRLTLPAYHDGQQRIIGAAKRFTVVECGRRFGKSTMGLNLLIERAVEGYPVGWFAPTYKLLAEIFQQAARLLKPVITKQNRVDARIELITGGILDFWSLVDVDAGRGRKYKRIVIDEASLVRDLEQCWEAAIRPTLTDLRGDAWFLGTPKGRNMFHRLFQRGESGDGEWISFRAPTTANPYMPADEVAAAKLELPAHVYAQEYEGIPADDGGNPFGLDAIRACTAPFSPGPAVVYGLDLAKSQDWTWLVGLDARGQQCVSDRWRAPWEDTIGRILARVGSTPCLVDSTGVGDPVLEQLQRRGQYGVFAGYVFSQGSKQRLMEGLAVALQTRAIGICDEVLIRELESFEYEYTRTGVRYEAPTGLHDDGVCALALAVQLRSDRALMRAHTQRLLGV